MFYLRQTRREVRLPYLFFSLKIIMRNMRNSKDFPYICNEILDIMQQSGPAVRFVPVFTIQTHTEKPEGTIFKP